MLNSTRREPPSAPDGSLYVADSAYHRIRKITNGIITTVAGTGVPGYTGDGGTGRPRGAIERSERSGIPTNAGIVYIADTGNNVDTRNHERPDQDRGNRKFRFCARGVHPQQWLSTLRGNVFVASGGGRKKL